MDRRDFEDRSEEARGRFAKGARRRCGRRMFVGVGRRRVVASWLKSSIVAWGTVVVLALAGCGSVDAESEQLVSGTADPVDTEALADAEVADAGSDSGSARSSSDSISSASSAPTSTTTTLGDGSVGVADGTSSLEPVEVGEVEPIAIDGVLLSDAYTEPAGWGGLQFSFRNIVQTTYQGSPAISAEFFAKSVVEDEGRFGVELLSLVQPGVAYPTPAVALTDRTGSFGDTFVVPGDEFFYGVLFFPVEADYVDSGELAIRVGTYDLVYSDVRLDGSTFDEPDYPLFVDLEEAEAFVLSGAGLSGVDCTTDYAVEQSVVISSSDPIRYYPAPHNTRFVLVEAKVVPVVAPDPTCPSTEVVAEALAPVLTSDAGETTPLVSEAELSALPGAPEAAAYVGLWHVPASTSELTVAPSHPDGEPFTVAVELDLYDSERTPAKTLTESEAERDDG